MFNEMIINGTNSIVKFFRKIKSAEPIKQATV